MKLTPQKTTPDESFVERYQKTQSLFSSFIDLIPSKIYLNPEDHTNWTKFATADPSKKKSKQTENEIDQKAVETSIGDDSDIEAEVLDEFSYVNKFDPRIFKTVSQIFSDFQIMEEKEKKIARSKLHLKKNPNSLDKSAQSVKLFNKSQHKSLTKQETDGDGESTSKSSSSTPKKPVKRVSKQKEQKNIAVKRQRQRYDSHTEPQIVDINHSEANSIKDRKQILNRNGQVVFSKFDFTADKTLKTKTPKHAQEKVNLREDPKDYKKLIKKLQDKREHIDKLKLTEPAKAVELETTDKWKTAIDKAAGVKVKDDVGLLKKALKKVEKKKDKSRKDWSNRVKEVKHNKDRAQGKRTKNIEKRREKIKENKVKKLKKKGRIMPGF